MNKTKYEKHFDLCKELNDLYIRKNQDYGDSFKDSFNEEGMSMVRIRLGDKFNRLKTLTRNSDRMVKDESIRDTLIDLANYALMTIVEMEHDEIDSLFAEDQMSINDYQEKALRTAGQIDDKLILNGALGLCGESGEVADIIKKWEFQGHDLDRDHIAEELGDVAWYLATLSKAIGYDLETILRNNVKKLKNRYPNGFNSYRSIHRDEMKGPQKNEAEELEKTEVHLFQCGECGIIFTSSGDNVKCIQCGSHATNYGVVTVETPHSVHDERRCVEMTCYYNDDGFCQSVSDTWNPTLGKDCPQFEED